VDDQHEAPGDGDRHDDLGQAVGPEPAQGHDHRAGHEERPADDSEDAVVWRAAGQALADDPLDLGAVDAIVIRHVRSASLDRVAAEAITQARRDQHGHEGNVDDDGHGDDDEDCLGGHGLDQLPGNWMGCAS
jgi:hypothetical protein